MSRTSLKGILALLLVAAALWPAATQARGVQYYGFNSLEGASGGLLYLFGLENGATVEVMVSELVTPQQTKARRGHRRK